MDYEDLGYVNWNGTLDSYNLTNTTNVTTDLPYENSKASFYEFVHLLYKYAIPMISIIGIFGNIASIKVFMFTSFGKHASCIYLTALSVSDTLFLIALLVGWMGSFDNLHIDSGAFCIISIYVTYVSSFLSVWYVVLIMIDRYIVVCHPLRGPRMCSRQRAIIAVSIITTAALLFYTHCFFMTTKRRENKSFCVFEEEDIHFLTVLTYIDTSITFIVPFLAIFVLSICVIVSIRRFHFRHFRFHEQRYYSPKFNILSKAQVRLTVMFVVVSCVFLVLNLPSHGFRFFILVNDLTRNKRNGLVLFLIQQCLQILYYTNFSINFGLYVISSKSFRRCLREPCKRR
ncbi:hypothetical protein FSP39_024377 [Pinctada imbricata]|uniref:G-protein coupled receptors family 1 profile domain-containing protein n=1 Tax=Pinctada imbricata TaxID=66713 RepID=A0AA88YG32_PINIB|nr:hypothetical protein FSP39_024377 [Pinctada imbricata]